MIKRILTFTFSGIVFLYSVLSLYKILRTIAPDFSVYYGAAQSLIHHQSLYTIRAFTIFNYPPISAFFFVPIACIPYQIAQGIFLILSYLSIFASVFLCFKILNKKINRQTFLFTSALFLLSFPTKFTLGMGQSNLIAYALLLLAIFFEQKNKQFSSGIILAIAIILKPILVFGILYFVFTRKWKTIGICISIGLVFLLLQQLLFPQTASQWITYLTHILPELMITKEREVYYNQGLLGTVSRLTTSAQARQLVDWVGVSIILVAVGKNIFQPKQNYLRLALLLCALPLIDSLSWQHHFVVLLFPFVVAFYQLSKNKVGLSLLAVSYVLISYNIKTPSTVHFFFANVVLSHVFWGTVLLLGILLYIAKALQRGK